MTVISTGGAWSRDKNIQNRAFVDNAPFAYSAVFAYCVIQTFFSFFTVYGAKLLCMDVLINDMHCLLFLYVHG